MPKTSSDKHLLLKGTFILTATGFITRIIGFFYRIFLSHTFGEEGVGLYQLIFPVYALCFSFTCAGLQLAISRCVARYKASGNTRRAMECLYGGLSLSVILSVCVMFLLQNNNEVIALRFLGDVRCAPLLSAMAYAFPFASIHSCIVGYYIGLKATKIPAISQLVEQVVRIVSVYALYIALSKNHANVSVTVAVCGLVFGEISSAAFILWNFGRSIPHLPQKENHMLSSFFETTWLSIPLTANRIMLNILQSIEAVSIPAKLLLYGYTTKEALSIYGVLTGMALPCILFPSAISNSIATMLLPAVAEMQSNDSSKSLKTLTRKVSIVCIMLGSGCTVLFLVSARFIGEAVFQSPLAGKFIFILAWICPFLYVSTTLISTLNGLGKTFLTLCINVLGLCIRIGGVFFLTPFYGIKGYLYGLLISQIVVTLLCYVSLWFYLLPKVKKHQVRPSEGF